MGSIKIKGTTSGSILLTAPDTGADNVPVEFDTFLAKTGDGSGLTGVLTPTGDGSGLTGVLTPTGDGSQLTNLPSTDTVGDSASDPLSSTLSYGWNNYTRQARVYLAGYPTGTYVTTMKLMWWTQGQYSWDPSYWAVASTTEYAWGSRGTSSSTYVNIGPVYDTATSSYAPYLTFSNTVRTS